MPDGMGLSNHGHRVITVRLSSELHRKLKITAAEQELTLNALCVKALESIVTSGKMGDDPNLLRQ